jgi:hypothetical protein
MDVAVDIYKSQQCRYCERCWPKYYGECPCCREPTFDSANPPLHEETADLLAKQFGFGWWLWDTGRL